MNEEKVVVEGEVIVEETKVVEVKKNWFAKPIAFVQKHKVAITAGVVGVIGVVAGYAIGKQAGIDSVDTCSEDEYEAYEDDSEDVEVTEV